MTSLANDPEENNSKAEEEFEIEKCRELGLPVSGAEDINSVTTGLKLRFNSAGDNDNIEGDNANDEEDDFDDEEDDYYENDEEEDDFEEEPDEEDFYEEDFDFEDDDEEDDLFEDEDQFN